MAKTYINNNTLHYALKVLNTKKERAEHVKNNEEKAYYSGLLAMLNLIISEEFTGNKWVEFNKELNTHKIIINRSKKKWQSKHY